MSEFRKSMAELEVVYVPNEKRDWRVSRAEIAPLIFMSRCHNMMEDWTSNITKSMDFGETDIMVQ